MICTFIPYWNRIRQPLSHISSSAHFAWVGGEVEWMRKLGQRWVSACFLIKNSTKKADSINSEHSHHFLLPVRSLFGKMGSQDGLNTSWETQNSWGASHCCTFFFLLSPCGCCCRRCVFSPGWLMCHKCMRKKESLMQWKNRWYLCVFAFSMRSSQSVELHIQGHYICLYASVFVSIPF